MRAGASRRRRRGGEGGRLDGSGGGLRWWHTQVEAARSRRREKERDARENEESKVALDRASVSPSASLVVRRSLPVFLPRGRHTRALARGELHNSWPYYTPTAASPAYPLYRGPPPSPNPSCTTELSLRASTFSFFLAGVSLSRVHCTSPLYARAFNPMHTKESMCARAGKVYTVDKVGSDDEVYACVPKPSPSCSARRM